MKILQVVPGLRTGGAETLVRHYCLKMSKGNDVKCIVMGGSVPGEPNKLVMEENKIPILYMRSDEGELSYFRKIWIHLGMVFKFYQVIKKEKPDVVHIHLVYFRYLLMAFLLYRDCKYFYTLHSVIPRAFMTKSNFFLAKILNRLRLIKFITLHKEMESDFERLVGGQKGIIVRNGIELNDYISSHVKQNDYRKKLGIGENEFVIGHVGSLSPVKNHYFLLRVFSEVLRYMENSRLLLIGSGHIEDAIMHEADNLGVKKKIIWLKNRSDIPDLLSVMDVFVFPSFHEGFPLAVLEAQAAGLRCIISDRITNDVLLTDKICKMDIDVEPALWAEEIIHPTEHEKHTGLSEYNLDNIIERVLDIYEGRIVS